MVNRRYYKKMKPAEIQVNSISSVLELYAENVFIVNRNYQRKLVWTLEEKVELIDTILTRYTVPMFMFGASYNSSNEEQLEIIDGLQRLDAIFSFIFNEFYITVNNQKMYFDLDQHYVTMEMKEHGLIAQKYPVMSPQLCEKFKAYNLAFSITKAPKSVIEETFRRVNSSGKKLSSQDLRQAGVSNGFSKTVNKIATEIRRDVSTDNLLPLSSVKKISISNYGLPYGIDVKSIFWVKQGIIAPENIRDSRDEELIARILARVVLGNQVGNSVSTLNNLYDENSQISLDFDQKVQKLGGADVVAKNIVSIIELFNGIFTNQTFSSIFEQNGSVKVEGKRNTFLIIAIAFYDKVFNEGKKLINERAVISIIKNSYGVNTRNYQCINRTFNREVREELVKELSESLEVCFQLNGSNEKAGEFINTDIKDFECLIHNPSLESQMIDYKVAVCNLDNGVYNKRCLQKIVKTLTAMANTKLGYPGYVVLGVTDSKESAEKYERLFSVKAAKYLNLFITGIEGEAKGNLDAFLRKLQQEIGNEPILPEVVSAIGGNLKTLQYSGHNL